MHILISIHALLAESDLEIGKNLTDRENFYPRSPCGERRDVIAVMTDAQSISIHALLAESDLEQSSSYSAYLEISIHALLAESDPMMLSMVVILISFLSTLSLRRATLLLCFITHPRSYFYPRSPCGERQAICKLRHSNHSISIHALLAESDYR